jgi:hypothetical protein
MYLQLEKTSMMAGKECKELVYELLVDRHLHVRAVSTAYDFVPARTTYLLRHDTHGICHLLERQILQAINNVRAHELATGRQLRYVSLL